MDVGIHEAGCDCHALGVQHFDVGTGRSPVDVFFHFDDDAIVIDQNVAQTIQTGIWVHDVRSVDQQHIAPPFCFTFDDPL